MAAGKVLALWGRREPRDYVDVHVALTSGEYSEADLLRLAQRHALLGVERVRDTDLGVYGVAPHSITALRQRLRRWGQTLTGEAGTESRTPSNNRQ